MNYELRIKNKKFIGKERGFTLVETLVGLLIFAFAVTATLVVTGQGVFNTNYAKNKLVAGYLAQEGLELVHYVRDTLVLIDPTGGWNDLRARAVQCDGQSGNNCEIDTSVLGSPLDRASLALYIPNCGQSCILNYDDSSNSYYTSRGSGSPSAFSRVITLDATSGEYITVTSTVSWIQGTLNHTISVSENLFNWTSVTP